MAGRAVAMESRLLAVFTAGLSSVNVSRLCDELGLSRQTFYKYRRRFAREGPAGLIERSRRPRSSPLAVDLATETEIVRLRKEFSDDGRDHGAQSIAYRLRRDGWQRVPSVATIHRVLVRRGQVSPQPEKRPKTAGRRFVFEQPNGAWQIDATQWVLADGRQLWIMNLLDDHSRLITASVAAAGATSEIAWEALCRGGESYGLPEHVISDNGACFTGRFLSGAEVIFEQNLRRAGIRHIRSTPGHPQTCGKLERWHQTLKRWLRAHPLAASQVELQAQLDLFLRFYNHERGHRALNGATPFEAWTALPRAHPGKPTSSPTEAKLVTIEATGRVSFEGYVVQVGAEYGGWRVLVIRNQLQLTFIADNRIIHRLTIDPARRYQPNGRPPGRPPRPNRTRN
ncbi:MAG TPA: IS481 family transposase [Acidimicrobiia bacterium]|nr:IS481 family transposase [Acidimicrobiia bacterium]